MSTEAWRRLEDALEGGASVRFWLRDDDAVAVTPALERLHGLCERAHLPLLLAVIPAGATAALGTWVAARSLIAPCQHGYAHRNHAAPGERACELGGARDDAAVLEELARGRAAMDAVFGPAGWVPVLVPPWNRMRDSLAAHLPDLGFTAVSTFASAGERPSAGPPRLDCDLDIIDWRNGRRGRDAAALCDRLVTLVAAKRETGDPIGLLTHHLAHDEACWHFLERLLPLIARHPGVTLVGAADLLDPRPPATRAASDPR